MSLNVNFDTQNPKAKPKSKTTIKQTNPVIGEKLNGGAKVNGIIEHFEQGEKAGDCRALSQLIGLSYTTVGKKAIKDSVKPDGMGGAIVTFKGAKGKQKEFRISIEEFNRYENGKIYSKGDDDVLCIEIAMIKYLKSLGVKIPDNGIHGDEVAQLGKNELVGLLIGDNVKSYLAFDGDNKQNVKNYLKEFEKNPNNYICEVAFKDFYSMDIYPAHAYAVKRIENNGSQNFVILINPYNSTKEIKMTYNQFIYNALDVTLFDLTGKNNNRNLMDLYSRQDEKWNNEDVEHNLNKIKNNQYQDKNGRWWAATDYDVFERKINSANNNELKSYINRFSDLQRYIIMKNYADKYINELDNRYMGWNSENIQNKKDVIQPFINSAINHAKLYGISDKDINEFKNACAKELNAKFYTNQSKIIEAFEKFIKIVENAKEEYYEGCH